MIRPSEFGLSTWPCDSPEFCCIRNRRAKYSGRVIHICRARPRNTRAFDRHAKNSSPLDRYRGVAQPMYLGRGTVIVGMCFSWFGFFRSLLATASGLPTSVRALLREPTLEGKFNGSMKNYREVRRWLVAALDPRGHGVNSSQEIVQRSLRGMAFSSGFRKLRRRRFTPNPKQNFQLGGDSNESFES